jgi:hypothetical protein
MSGSDGRSERVAAFLAGERPDDVALFLSEGSVDGVEKLAAHGERVEGGVLVVVSGQNGRNAFTAATGLDAFTFAREAMDREGEVARDLSGGRCPDCDAGPEFVFAFAEEENEEAGGLYAEGSVLHAYARCACGVAYADRWVADA